MSPRQSPQAGITDALEQLSDNTRLLVREELAAAREEMWHKARGIAPGVAAIAAAGTCATFATASAYRLSLRLLDKALPPATAALVATLGYGAGAGLAARVAVRRVRSAEPPFPTETATRVMTTAAEVAPE